MYLQIIFIACHKSELSVDNAYLYSVDSEIQQGSIVYIICHLEYDLYGSTYAECRGGQWIHQGPFPECRKPGRVFKSEQDTNGLWLFRIFGVLCHLHVLKGLHVIYTVDLHQYIWLLISIRLLINQFVLLGNIIYE